MAPTVRPVVAFLMAMVWALLVVLAIGTYSGRNSQDVQQDCVRMAWRVANRNHSILDSAAFRRTEHQAFETCMTDPDGFGRMVGRGP